MMKAVCMECGNERKSVETRCLRCGGIFRMDVSIPYRDRAEDNFPYVHDWVSLGEVETPILDYGNLLMKLEYFSPTFSYKDRGTKTMISSLKGKKTDNGITEINEDSSGNAGASVSAYGRKAGFDVNIFVPETTPGNKIAQIEAYGAKIFRIGGSRDDVRKAAEANKGYYASHVLTPEFRDGIRIIPYEIFNQLSGRVPDRIFIPVSAGTLLLGVVSGFEHLLSSGEISRIPEIVAVQTEQVSPLCSSINGRSFDPDAKVESVADALVSMKPPLIKEMESKVREFGRCITVNEEEIINARNALALKGVYAEYSSATVYAAYGKIKEEGKNMLIITGNGLKSPIL